MFADNWVVGELAYDEGNGVGDHYWPSLDQCKIICANNPNCHSFAYGSSSRACHEKDKCINSWDATRYVSGYKTVYQYNTTVCN